MIKRLRHYQQGCAIVLCCFGSVVAQQRYQQLADRLAQEYPECDVHMAVSSKMVIKKSQLSLKTLPQVLADLEFSGYKQVLVVSAYLFPTDEHLQLKKVVEGFSQFSFANYAYTPALFNQSQQTGKLLDELDTRFDHAPLKLYVFHGAPYLDNPGHQSIGYVRDYLELLDSNALVCSLEGAWPFKLVERKLLKMKQQLGYADDHRPELEVIPLLLASGNHFMNDLHDIQQHLEAEFDVTLARDENGEAFNLLGFEPLYTLITQQIEHGLMQLDVQLDKQA
ncbi:sirohydrochlorin cobaltochelatase [Vibrio sp. LaRot3]|uniref:sirohydrochlorin cobaltochelatase n=1 Tax=Vibrio sp. LaRot3 TaxID=2998829 RepID=UPI0022CDBEEE|nr:sirohydrochlorin cobaltochelatase [Vibrio sp. LaRot3]MDA0149606.1 sirohydrochlorin cobaltochelatase [Vibrio sp. LaRot3]